MRLDAYLAAEGLAASRQKALWLIENGYVSVDGKITMKASTHVEDDMDVSVAEVKTFVGRAWCGKGRGGGCRELAAC